jgi:hypothetical protein
LGANDDELWILDLEAIIEKQGLAWHAGDVAHSLPLFAPCDFVTFRLCIGTVQMQ